MCIWHVPSKSIMNSWLSPLALYFLQTKDLFKAKISVNFFLYELAGPVFPKDRSADHSWSVRNFFGPKICENMIHMIHFIGSCLSKMVRIIILWFFVWFLWSATWKSLGNTGSGCREISQRKILFAFALVKIIGNVVDINFYFPLIREVGFNQIKLPKVEFQEVDPDSSLDRSLVFVIAEKEDLGPA